MVWHFLSLPFLLLSFFLIVFALITAVVSVVAIVSVVALACLRCSLFAILRYYTYRFFVNQSTVPFSVGSSTTRIPFNAGGTSSGSDSICSQGYVMDCFIAVQRSFLSWNRYLQCIIGDRVWPVSVYYFHLQRLKAHFSVQSISLPHHWWIWKGFWNPKSYHGLTPRCKICWELFPCFQWFWFAFANQCHRFSTFWATHVEMQ